MFLGTLVNFIGVGVILYFIANVYGYFSKDSIIKYTVKCQFCRKEISSKVRSDIVYCCRFEIHVELMLTIIYIGKTVPYVYVLDGRERSA